ncbi:hypothetical protein OAA03_00645 [bacterium]|nr:hypothetical protein [bacterium]
MAQDKRVFTGGMDKDSEPRLIKQGDYRDAKNIRNIASSDGTSGSVENIEGTQEVNYNFIDESETTVEIIDEQFVEEPTQIFHYQDLIIHQREFIDAYYHFKLYSRSYGPASSGDNVGGVTSHVEFNWTGNPTGGPNNTSLTSIYLLEQFGESGVSSEDIQIVSTTGESITVHTEVYQGQYLDQNNVLNTEVPFSETFQSGGQDCYIIRFIADVPEVEFELDFNSTQNFASTGDSALNIKWSETVSEPDYTLGWYNISNIGVGNNLIIMSQRGVQTLIDGEFVDASTSEDDGLIGSGDNPFSGNDSTTEVQMTITGVNPTTPQDPQNEFKIFSIIENGNGTFQAIPFAQNVFDQFESDFNSGDPFEFDGDQNEIAASLHDKLSVPFSTQILVSGLTSSTTHTISTLNNNVATSFEANTQLGVVRSSNLSATASSSSFYTLESYNSLSSFSSYRSSGINFIEANSSVSILNDSITIENPVQGSFNREVFFPVPLGGIVKGDVYRIEANISTFSSSGNSINFQTQDGKNVSPAITSTNSSFSFQFEAQENNQLFKLVVDNDFAEQDTIVLSNVSIKQFKSLESELIVTFRAPYNFDLVFSTDSATAISDYQAGTQQTSLEWFNGVNVNLNQTIQYGGDYDNLIEEISSYESQILELNNTITGLTSQLTNLTLEYNSTIASINAAIDLDSSDAIASYNLISDSSNNLISVINSNDETLSGLIGILEANITDGNYDEGYGVGLEEGAESVDITSYIEEIASLQSDLDAAIENAENINTTVVNATGQNLITNGDFGDSSEISSSSFTTSLDDGSNGWIHYNDPSNFGSGVNVTEESVTITTTEDSSTLKLSRGQINSIHITAAAAFNNTTETLNVTESGKFYRLSFDVVKSISTGFSGAGDEETSEISYYDGTSSWISCGSVSGGDQKTIYYEATGSTFAIRLNENNRDVRLDNFNLQEISSDSIDDYQALLIENEIAQQELLNIQNAVNEALGSVQLTTLGGVQNLINAYDQASSYSQTVYNELGGLITLLNNASFSNEEVQGNIASQITILENAIQAIVDIDSSISSNSNYSDIAGFVTAASTVNNDYSVLVSSITELQQTVGSIIETGENEGFASTDGYSITSPNVVGDYALYQAQLDAMTGNVQTLLNSLNSLAIANSGLTSDLENQAITAAEAADAAAAQFAIDLAAANAATQAAVEALTEAQADFDNQLALLQNDADEGYLYGYTDAAILFNQELEPALQALNVAISNLEVENPDVANAQANLTALISTANGLQFQLDNIVPEDGVSQSDVDAAIAIANDTASSLQLALDESLNVIDLLSANIITNGDFDGNSDEGITIGGNQTQTTLLIDNESLVFSNPTYLENSEAAATPSAIIDIGELTGGTYLFNYSFSGAGVPGERFSNFTEQANEYMNGSGITRLSDNSFGNSRFITYYITPVNPGDTYNVSLFATTFDGAIDNIKLFKVPDNLVLPTDTPTLVSNVFQTIQQLVTQQGVAIANLHTGDDLLESYNTGLLDGAASVDITSDNQAIQDEAYLFGYNDGAASVTPEDGVSQSDLDAAVAEAQAVAAAAYAQDLLETSEFYQSQNNDFLTDIFSMLGLLTTLTSTSESFTATALFNALNDLTFISLTTQASIDEYNEEYFQEVSNINEIISIIQLQISSLIENPVQSNNVNEEFSFVLFGDVNLQGASSYSDFNQGRAIRLLYWNENVPTHQAPLSSRYIELVPNEGTNFSSGILNSCHLFDNTESHASDGTYSSLEPHDHIRIISTENDSTSILKLSIKNFNSSNTSMSETDGPTILSDYEFIDNNNQNLDRGFHITISVLAGDPSWEFALEYDDGTAIGGSNLSGGSLTYINLMSGSFETNSLAPSGNNLLTGTAAGETFESNGGFISSSPTNPIIPAWLYNSVNDRWENRSNHIAFKEDFLTKSITLEPNTTYEVMWNSWMHSDRNYSVDLGDNSVGPTHANFTSSAQWTLNYNILENGVRRWEAEPGVSPRVAFIDENAGPGANGMNKVIITTGPNYSANILRIYGGVPDPDPNASDLGKLGGFTGRIDNISIKKISSNTEATVNYDINLLYERTSTSFVRSQLSNPLYNNSRILNGSARRIVKDKLTGITKERPVVAGGYKCIGSYEDKPNNRVYYFICNERTQKKYDCILEYDLMNDLIQTVYQDDRPSSDNSQNNILNFSEHHLITGVNKIDDILYWTDNLNRPRKINVELAKQNEKNIENPEFIFKDAYYKSSLETVYIGVGSNFHPFEAGDHIYSQIGVTSGASATGINGYSEIIGVVRKPSAGTTFNVEEGSAIVNASTGHNLDDFVGDWIGIQESGSNNFPIYYQISSVSQNTITLASAYNGQSNTAALPVQFNGQNAVGLITNSPWPGSFTPVDGVVLYADPYSDIRLKDAYSPLISFGTREDKMRYFDVVKHQPTHKPDISIDTDMSFAANNILDNVFQFKYRYVHKDDEQTSYGPISDVVIDPVFALNAAVDAADYGAIANKITITYDDTIADVKDIEIVARKGNNGEFVLVDTLTNNFIKYLKKVKNSYLPEYQFTDIQSSVNFYNNGTYPFVDKKDSDKLYDVVPKLAKAQTILSNNRLAYGNVLEGYDNTRLIANSGYSFEEGTALDSSGSSILTSEESGVGGWTTINGELFETNFGGNGGNTFHRQKFYLGNLNLSSDNIQTIFINYSWTYVKDPFIGGEIDRNGSFSLPNINATGISNVDELGNLIAASINAGNGNTTTSGIGSSGSNETSASYESGSNLLELEIKYTSPNVTSSMGSIDWDSGDFKPANESIFITGDAGLSSFKTGAFHNFGIAYFDETNRCSFVNTAPDYQGVTAPGGVPLNGTRPYNKFFTESAGTPANTPSTVDINIYSQPPIWATNYQFYYTGNTTIDEFIQMMFVGAKVATDSNDKQIYLNMGALKGKDWSYNQANNSQIDYNYVAGDRIRFISFDPGNGRQTFGEYIDLEIAGMDLYIGEDGDPFSVDSETEGFYLRINDPGNSAVLTESGTINIAHSGFSYTSSGYEKLIAEIYRPKKDLDEDLMVYYEIGDKIPIKSPGTPVRAHGGTASQGQLFNFNKEIGDYISDIPATVRLSSGDIYFKPRSMATETDGSPQEVFFPEDYYLNDFHRTNHYSRGRVNVVNNNSAERRLEASVYFSETYSSTGSVNGLSSFNPANSPYFDYNKNFGSIQALKMRDNDLLIFHESKVGRVLVQKDILNTASGEGLVSLSTNVIGNYVNLYKGEYGCCLQPESIVGFGNVFYFIDIKRGAALRLSADGLTVTSDQGMRDYFRDIGEMYVINDPEVTQIENPFSIVAGYDPKYDEYIVTFPNVFDERKSLWDKDFVRWDSEKDKYQNKEAEIIYESKTLAFNERTNRWTSFYDFYPDYYGRVGRQFIGFKEGRLYKHNMTDRLYQDLYVNTEDYIDSKGNSKYNSFYGQQFDSHIEFPFNIEPSSIKSFNTISLEGDAKLFTSMYTNTGQVIQGNGLENGYKNVIRTNIGYRYVEGDIFNYADNNGLEPYVRGDGTKFLDNLKKGDVVRIFGSNKDSESYAFVTRVVLSVVSNTLLLLSENINLILEGNHMEVLDYKTKEGVHYSMIPFVESIINTTDRGDLIGYENQGDGSEITGIGFVQSNQNLGYNLAAFFGNFNNSVYSLNKKISPIDMFVGAEYVLAEQNAEDPFQISSVNYNFSYQNSVPVVGDVFICQKNTDSFYSSKVISTDIKLYIRRPDNQVILLGYPYSITKSKISFVKNPDYSLENESGGFLFVVKNGNVEGEKMKGQYMMTKLTTEHPGPPYLSKYKFNLYGANVDIDKSELSNK